MTFRRFEDMETWKTARALAGAIYRAAYEGGLRRDHALQDQIRRAAVSVMANIAEGSSYRSDKEFVRFLIIARGSVTGVQSHLYILLDQAYFNEDQFRQLNQLAEKCSRQLANLISFLLGHKRRQLYKP